MLILTRKVDQGLRLYDVDGGNNVEGGPVAFDVSNIGKAPQVAG